MELPLNNFPLHRVGGATKTKMTIAQLNKLAQEIANLLGDLDEAALIKVLAFVKEAAEPTAAE
jgi:hypothetical protein